MTTAPPRYEIRCVECGAVLAAGEAGDLPNVILTSNPSAHRCSGAGQCGCGWLEDGSEPRVFGCTRCGYVREESESRRCPRCMMMFVRWAPLCPSCEGPLRTD